MHILLTRPEADADELGRRLESAGHEVSRAPLIAIEHVAEVALDLEGVQALVVTSRNALRALKGSKDLAAASRLPLFTVGPATTAEARTLGFAEIHEGHGAARSLVPLIVAGANPSRGTVLHVCGDHVAFDLRSALAARGLAVRNQVVYRSRAASELPHEVVAAVRRGSLDAVILMSPRTARIWAGLVDKAQIGPEARKLRLVCLSEAVAAGLGGHSHGKVSIARQANLQEILALIGRMSEQSG